MNVITPNYTVFISSVTPNTTKVGQAIGELRKKIILLGVSPDYIGTVEGVYNGEREPSLAVPVPTMVKVGELLEIARQYNQESIMVVDFNNSAFLMFSDGSIKSIGSVSTLRNSPENRVYIEAICKSYSIIPSTNTILYTL